MKGRMGIFEEISRQSRVLMSRDWVADDSTIERFGMGRIDNGIFSEEDSDVAVEMFIDECMEKAWSRRQVCIIDKGMRYVAGTSRHVRVVSAMYFKDMWSWHRFAMWRWDWYWELDDKSDAFSMLVN